MVNSGYIAKRSGQEVIVGGVKAASGEQRFSGSGRPEQGIPVDLVVTDASGTSPTLNVVLEQSVDGGVNWTNKATFAQKTGAGSETVLLTPPHQDYLRVRWTIGGTGSPSFSFTVRLNFDTMVK